MEKVADDENFMNISTPTVLRYGLGGLGLGAGAASALSLINMLKRMREDNKEESKETDDKTIVLTLPRKQASDLSEAGIDQPVETPETTKMVNKEEDGVANNNMVTSTDGAGTVKRVAKETTCTNSGQIREFDGRYSLKIQKTANWPTLTAALLAGGAGTIAGYKVVDKVYEMRRMKEKEQELEAAKQEYLDMLSKASSAGEKTAEGGDFSVWDYPAGLGALALILGSGASAYITKRVLDEHARPQEPEELQKIKRIVFRSAPPIGAEDKTASADDHEGKEIIKAALGVMLDICGSKHDILKTAYVAEAIDKLGMNAGDLYKMAASDYSNLMATLQANPDLRKLITRATMEQHPILKYFKWTAGMPGVRGYADNKIYEGVANALGQPQQKVANLVDLLKGVAVSTIGSNIAEKDNKPVVEEKKEEPVADEGIDVEVEDPEAAKFVLENEEKIRKVIETLRVRGQI